MVFQVIQDGGPILYHNDSEEQERSFASTCSKFRRFLKGRSSVAPGQEAVEMTKQENPQNQERGFPSFLESANPRASHAL
jgi:hypothetical protein